MDAIDRRRLAACVKWYLRTARPKERDFLDWYERLPTLEVAIQSAAYAKCPNGKRHPHQCRRKHETLDLASKALLAAKGTLKRCRTFDDLMIAISGAVGPIHDIGELYIYDTATRIGAKLGLYPDHVYLHTGARDGARLLGITSENERYLYRGQMPKEMSDLEPYEMEDVLCICRHWLANRIPDLRTMVC